MFIVGLLIPVVIGLNLNYTHIYQFVRAYVCVCVLYRYTGLICCDLAPRQKAELR